MLEQKIEALTRAVEALTLAMTTGAPAKADAVKATDPIPEPTPQSPAPAPEFNDQALKDVTLAKSREGHTDAIRNKLNEMGAKKLQDLAQDQAAEFYQWVIALGNN